MKKTKIDKKERKNPRRYEMASHSRRVEFRSNNKICVLYNPRTTGIVFIPLFLSPSISRTSEAMEPIKTLRKKNKKLRMLKLN